MSKVSPFVAVTLPVKKNGLVPFFEYVRVKQLLSTFVTLVLEGSKREVRQIRTKRFSFMSLFLDASDFKAIPKKILGYTTE
jgi:hypothetical protein